MSYSLPRYIIFLIIAILGNPIYQMVSYLICASLNLGQNMGCNTYQANPIAFFTILSLIFAVRLLLYSILLTNPQMPFSYRGKNNFVFLFCQRHLPQAVGMPFLLIWLSQLEGNVIGFFVFPLTLLAGGTTSIITFIRILKTRKIYREPNT